MPNLPLQEEIILGYLKLFSIFPELSHLQISWSVVNNDTIIAEVDLLPQSKKNYPIKHRVISFLQAWYNSRLFWDTLTGRYYIEIKALTSSERANIYYLLRDFNTSTLKIEAVDFTKVDYNRYYNIDIVHLVDTVDRNIEKLILDAEKQYA